MKLLSRRYLLGIIILVFIVTLSLFYNIGFKGHNNADEVNVTAKLTQKDIKSGQNVMLDINVENQSNVDIYNLEILTEFSNKYYAQAYGNWVVKSLECLKAGDTEHLRAVYAINKSDNEKDIFEGYDIKIKNNGVLIVLALIYLVLVVILSLQLKSNKWINLVLLGCFVCLTVSLLYLETIIIKGCRNDKIIVSYVNDMDVFIDGNKETLKVLINYTKDNDEILLDSNKNGIIDIEEKKDYKTDTDGDGLTDFEELFVTNTSPFMLDTYATGFGDVNCDIDKDGLTSLEEMNLGSNPLNKDTDYDGVEDAEELELGTNILEWDTDGDGMSDGFEITQGYNPLVKDIQVVVTKELKSDVKEPKNRIIASVEVSTNSFNAESLDINTYETMLLDTKIPGYIGSAFEFTIDDEFENAELRFEIDDYWINKKGCDPCIYYFNEDTQLLEELETSISGNVLSAKVRHFSVYIVLDRTEVSKWLYDDIQLQGRHIENAEHYISFVLDNSFSMTETDPRKESISVIKRYLKEIEDSNTQVSLTTFTAVGNLEVNFTKDYGKVISALNSIERDSGKNETSGTNIEEGLLPGLVISKQLSGIKNIILITDGEFTEEFNEKFLLNQMREAQSSLYCVDVGMFTNTILEELCVKSGGRYFLLKDINDNLLVEVFDDIHSEIEDIGRDSNSDGLSDYYSRFISDGTLKTGTGLTLAELCGGSIDLESSANIDGDLLPNGEEISVIADEGHTYLKVHSSPFHKDTDKDGILDGIDEAPFTFGQAGGIIGEMSIVSHPKVNSSGKSSENSLDLGHSWLIFTSYVTKEINSEYLRAGWVPIYIDDKLYYYSRHDFQYSIQPESSMSFGNYPRNKGEEGTWEDDISTEEIVEHIISGKQLLEDGDVVTVEFDKFKNSLRYNQEFKNALGEKGYYKGAIGYTTYITNDDFKNFVSYIDNYESTLSKPLLWVGNFFKSTNTYLIGYYSCIDFAVEAWNATVRHRDDKIHYETRSCSTPTGLCNRLREKKGSISDYDVIMTTKLHTVLPFLVIEDGRLVNSDEE